jgi:ferredoxin--NADP+ reductase
LQGRTCNSYLYICKSRPGGIKTFRILRKKELAQGIKSFEIHAPLIARKNQPGQFVVLRIDEKGERIPLTISKSNIEEGTITVVFQEVGKTTRQLGMLQEGDEVLDLVGPLGRPSEILNFGTVVIVGGGVGTAEAYPEACALKKAGNKIITIIGARSKDLLILEKEMGEVSDEIYITTDDGSKGHHGFVTDILVRLIEAHVKIDRVVAIGPTVMMKRVADITRPHQIKTIVSLNPIMLDATGMCGVCRVVVGGETKFACSDGPAFDAHLVDFNLLTARQRIYLEEEKSSLQRFDKRGQVLR